MLQCTICRQMNTIRRRLHIHPPVIVHMGKFASHNMPQKAVSEWIYIMCFNDPLNALPTRHLTRVSFADLCMAAFNQK